MIVNLFMKHNDCVVLSMGSVEIQGYLPHVNSVLGGDDTDLIIDNETGLIINWTPIRIRDGKFLKVDEE